MTVEGIRGYAVYRFFEQLIDPMDAPKIDRPPLGTAAFFKHYLQPVWPVILLALILTGVATVAELMLYQFLGQLVDWMGSTAPDQFFATHAPSLLVMILITAVVRPIALLSSRATINLALAPGFRFFPKRLCRPRCAKSFTNG